MRFQLDVLNDDKVRADLEHLGQRAATAKPVLERAAGILANGIIANFVSQGAAIGQPWPAKKDGTPATLREFGGLASAVGNLKRATNTLAVAGIRGPEAYIARFHQGGTSRGLPARPIVGVSALDRSRLLESVQTYLLDDGRLG